RLARKCIGDNLGSHSKSVQENIRTPKTVSNLGVDNGLPRTFKLSDAALATICNITRDLPPDDLVDAVYVKRTRHRLQTQGFSAVW
ncbi:hypothetical protein EGJ48_23675, partial [Pantoea dispersa]